MLSNTDLLERLKDFEDRFVERKPAAAGEGDFKRTIVAFANSVPQNRVGLLFIGIGDDGKILGVINPDKTQKKIRQLAQNDCYPPIFVDAEVLRIDDLAVVAVLVGFSNQRPHFAGGAFVRRGSESINASNTEYEELINSRVSIVRELTEWKGKTVTVTTVAKQLGDYFPLDENHQQSEEMVLLDINPHYVRFRRPQNHSYVTEIIETFRLSWDDMFQRPRLIAFPIRRVGI